MDFRLWSSMSVSDIADGLDQSLRLLRGRNTTETARHATPEATLDWGYDLCTDGEQRLLCALSVFAGSFDLEAGHAICGSGGAEFEMLDLLDALIEGSLVTIVQRRDRTRFLVA